MSEEDWVPAKARTRAALWGAERHLGSREYVAAADVLDDAFAYGDRDAVAVARGMRQLAAAGYRHREGDEVRARRHLGRAHARLSPFLPVYEEVDLERLLDVVAQALEP